MSSHVLVIGGTRFIGKAIVRKLTSQGYIVHVLHRGFHPLGMNLPNLIEYHGDARNPLAYRKIFKQYPIDFIIHTIAYSPDDIESLLQIQRVEQIPMIVISTGQVYLVTVGNKIPFREEDYNNLLMHAPENPEDYSQWEYGILKRNMEDTLTNWYREFRIPSFTLRSPVVQGNEDYSLRLYSYIKRVSDEYPFLLPFEGNVTISHIWVEDLANAVMHIIQQGFTERISYNISMEERLSLVDVIKKIALELNPKKPIHIPNNAIDEEEQKILMKASPYSGKWISVLDATRFKRDFNWKPTPFNEWFPKIVRHQYLHFEKEMLNNYLNRQEEIRIFGKLQSARQLTEL